MGKIRTKVIDLSQEEPVTKSKKEQRRSKKHRKSKAALTDVDKKIPKVPDIPDKTEKPKDEKTEKQEERPSPHKSLKLPKVKHGKKYENKNKLIDKNKEYPLDEAIELVKKSSFGKFDASIDVHINLGIDVTRSDQLVKFSITLPHNFTKPPKALIITNQSVAKPLPRHSDPERPRALGGVEGEESHPVLIGGEEVVQKIETGELKPGKDFEVVIAVPMLMSKVAKVAKILGPKGMMPSPKTGTVTNEPEKALEELTKGKMTLKNEPNAPIIHTKTGNCSFENSAIKENFMTLYNELLRNKPQKAKGGFVKSIFLTSTMGPSVKLSLTKL